VSVRREGARFEPDRGASSRTLAACEECLRRSRLLALLSARLDYRWRDHERLLGLLALEDEELLQALGGRRRSELKARYEADPGRLAPAGRWETVCRHDRRYPRALSGKAAPRMLNVAGGVERLRELTDSAVVAIVGSRRASDYGIEMAKSLARGLTASGVTVASGLCDGIAHAAHAGALEVDGRAVAVMSGGLEVACPAKRRSLYENVRLSGCAVAELPSDCPGRRWGRLASERCLAALAELVLVVEADERPAELACALIARELGGNVAAVPGRVTSPLSRGTHALLIGGAALVRGAEDALELLSQLGAPAGQTGVQATAEPRMNLSERLQRTLERVGAGEDTPDKLTGRGEDPGEVLLALSELEVRGLLARGHGGRYVPRDPPPAGASYQGGLRATVWRPGGAHPPRENDQDPSRGSRE
jgi:DNA processing protein